MQTAPTQLEMKLDQAATKFLTDHIVVCHPAPIKFNDTPAPAKPDLLITEEVSAMIGKYVRYVDAPRMDVTRREIETEIVEIDPALRLHFLQKKVSAILHEKLIAENDGFLKVSHGDWIDPALAAANIRKVLKKLFPLVKFKVSTERYSGGSSVDVYYKAAQWEDKTLIEDAVEPFQSGNFDGMDDSYSYKPFPARVFNETFGGAYYVSVLPQA